MVKIPTYDNQYKTRTTVTDAYTGFSGGEIQVASQSGNIGYNIKKTAEVVDKYQKVKQEREGKVWLSKSKSDMQIWMVKETERIKKENPNLDAKDHTKKVIESFKKKSDEIKKNAPNKWASDNWEINHNALLAAEFESATRYEAEASVTADLVGIEEAAKAATQVLMENPYEIVNKIAEIESLFTTYDNPKTKEIEGYAGRINIAKLNKKKKAIIGKMIKDTVESIIQKGDVEQIESAKALLGGKLFQKHLDIDTQQSLIKQLENKKVEKDGAFINEVNSQKEKNLNSIMTTGEPKFQDVEANLIAIHGEKSTIVDDYRRDVEMAKTIYNKSNEAYTGDKATHGVIIEELKEKMLTGDKRDEKIFMAVSQNIEIFNKMIKDNPMAWAREYRPELYERLSTRVDPSEDGYEEAFAKKQGAYKELIDLQTKFGIQQWDLKIVSNDVAEQYAKEIKSFPDAQAALNYFQFLKHEHGEEYFPILLDQMIQSKMLDPKWDAAIQYLNSPVAEDVIRNGVLNKADITKLSVNQQATVKTIKEEIRNSFEPIRLALTSTNNNAGSFVDGWISLVENYAINSFIRNGDQRSAAKAFKRFVEDKFIVSEQGVLIEKSSYKDDKGRVTIFEKEDYDHSLKTFINDELPKMTLVPMKQGGVHDAEDMIPYDAWHKENASINVSWRNTADGSGVELVWTNSQGWTYHVSSIGKVGSSDTTMEDDERRIVLTWEDLNAYTHALKHYQIRQESEVEIMASDTALRHRGYK